MSGNFPGSKEQKGNRVVEITPWEKGMHIGKNKQPHQTPPNNNKKKPKSKQTKNFHFSNPCLDETFEM